MRSVPAAWEAVAGVCSVAEVRSGQPWLAAPAGPRTQELVVQRPGRVVAGICGAARAGTGAAGSAEGNTSVGGTGMAKFPAAAPGAAVPVSAADAGLGTPPAMMRVNSPACDESGGAAAGGVAGPEATACCKSSVSLWISMVTLSGLLMGGCTGDAEWPPKDPSPNRFGGGSSSSERERNNWVSPPGAVLSPLGAGSKLCGHSGSTA